MESPSSQLLIKVVCLSGCRASDFGCQLITSCNSGNFPGVRSAVSSGASLDYQDGYGYTAAICCCVQGHPEILQYFLEQGANTELADIGGSTPLHYTAVVNKYDCAAVLLRHGVALDTINMYGETALWWASCEGHLPIVQLLVQAGADIDRACNDGKTPLAMARDVGHPEVVMYLSIEINWRRRKNYATMLNSIKGAPTDSKMMKAFQCHDVARMICSYI
jgi:ankyrin repeat protein